MQLNLRRSKICRVEDSKFMRGVLGEGWNATEQSGTLGLGQI